MYSSNLVELCVLCIISVKHRSRGLHLASGAVERDPPCQSVSLTVSRHGPPSHLYLAKGGLHRDSGISHGL
jgi:hypothetical protein